MIKAIKKVFLKTFPKEISEFLERYQKDCVTEQDCISCNSACCSHSGFAILENVEEIYKLYRKGLIVREDYVFEPGLSFKDFVFKYFDVISREAPDGSENLVFFHMRHISKDGEIISIPDGESYWRTRSDLFHRNPWLNHGCIFLSKRLSDDSVDDAETDRKCILHSTEVFNRLTAKPVDCLFFVCKAVKEWKTPAREETNEWFDLLVKNYPNSEKRFRRLIGYKETDA